MMYAPGQGYPGFYWHEYTAVVVTFGVLSATLNLGPEMTAALGLGSDAEATVGLASRVTGTVDMSF